MNIATVCSAQSEERQKGWSGGGSTRRLGAPGSSGSVSLKTPPAADAHAASGASRRQPGGSGLSAGAPLRQPASSGEAEASLSHHRAPLKSSDRAGVKRGAAMARRAHSACPEGARPGAREEGARATRR